MIILVSFSERDSTLFAQSAAEVTTGATVRCIDDLGALDGMVLSGVAETGAIDYPQVIILNLDAPNRSWRHSLSLLKNNAFWRHIPVAGFGFADEDDAVGEFYALGGASFISKPQSPAALPDVVGVAVRYWALVSILPDQFTGAD